MSGAPEPSGLLLDLEAAFAEVAAGALGLGQVVAQGRQEQPSQELQGAYLPLGNGQIALQIGIASNEQGCQALSRGLLGMGADAPPLDAAEMADAFCEITNIVAGVFKSRIRERAGSLAMGVPVFFHGAAQSTEHTAVDVTMVRAGASTAALLLVYPRRRPGA
jgi:CheY-specific phosphatase CheX